MEACFSFVHCLVRSLIYCLLLPFWYRLQFLHYQVYVVDLCLVVLCSIIKTSAGKYFMNLLSMSDNMYNGSLGMTMDNVFLIVFYLSYINNSNNVILE